MIFFPFPKTIFIKMMLYLQEYEDIGDISLRDLRPNLGVEWFEYLELGFPFFPGKKLQFRNGMIRKIIPEVESRDNCK